jgi:hypothetical protein
MAIESLSALASRLAGPSRLYLHGVDGVREPSGRRGRRYWVVSRALCRVFKVPPLPEGSTARQLEALDLQIARLSPFSETGSHAHFGAHCVNLWLWDAQVARETAAAIGIDARRVPAVPETALRPSAAGIRLVECLDGVEGQYWENGDLAASRWWPTLPDSRAWVLFQRGASLPAEQITPNPPPVTRLEWLDRPWTNAGPNGWIGLNAFDPQLVAAGIGLVFLIGYGYLSAEWLRLAWDTHRAEAAIAARSRQFAPVIEARRAALNNAATVRRLHDLDRYPGQLAMMARVAEKLPHNETHLTEWSYDDGKLEITVAADHPLDSVYFVRALERVADFKNVTAERARSDKSLHIRLVVEPR